MDQQPNQNEDNAPVSLETPQGSEPVVPAGGPGDDKQPTPAPEPQDASKAVKTKFSNRIFGRIKAINVYLLVFILVVILAAMIVFAVYQKSQKLAQQNTTTPSSQAINEEVLQQLKNTDVSIGQPKQILSVEANAIFAGSVLVRGDFETAGQIKTSSAVNATGINVAGTGTFQTLQASKLQVSGDSQLQGNLTIQSSLNVSGSGNFGGTLSANKLNVQTLELGGNLSISKHIDASGGNPSRSNGNALGGGGTSSVSGSDTAGTININTGTSPHSGCFITVNFTQSFSSPHVVVTPVGSGGAGLDYYVTRTTNGFSLCTASAASGGKHFSFDYVVID